MRAIALFVLIASSLLATIEPVASKPPEITVYRLSYLGNNLMMFGLILGYTAWIIGEIWLCADNVRNRLYGDMARLLTAAWAINSVLLVFFLTVQRLGGI